MNVKYLKTPFTKDKLKQLRAGDIVFLTGTIYSARDAAHMRMIEAINKGETLPFDIKNSIIYYVGPTPAKPGIVIGSAGPTTSCRMDHLTVPLLELGMKGMIGKGIRSEEVIENIVKNQAIYFLAIGGAGALISNSIKEAEVIAYNDLGTEAIRKLVVENLFLIVCIDIYGNYLFKNL